MKKETSEKVLSFSYHHILIIVIFTAFVYYQAICADFVYDDRPAILTNDDVLGRTSWTQLAFSNDFWGNPIRLEGSHKSYRPLVTASFRLQFGVHDLKAAWFHGVNVLCHVVNSILVWRLAKEIRIVEDDICLLASLLFASHPINTEAVCSIVGRADLLATTFILLEVILYLSQGSSPSRTVAFSILAVLSKETGIVCLPLIMFHEMLFKGPSKSRQNLITYSMALGAICYYRLALNNFQSPQFSKNDNPIAYELNWMTRTLTFLYLPVFHIKLMVFPKTLSFDWSMDAIPKVENVLDGRFLETLFFYGLGFVAIGKIVKKSNKEVLFLLSLLGAPHLMSSNLFAYVGFVAAERILYLPAVAYCILLAFGAQCLRKKFGGNVTWLIILLISMFTYRTMMRVPDWSSEESIFKSALPVNPTKAHMNLGYVYTSQGKNELAKEHYIQALRQRNNLADAWYNLAILTSKSPNSTMEAVRYYQQAILSRSNFAAAHLNLALLLWDLGRHQTSFDHLEKCLTVSGDNLKSFRNHVKVKATCAFNKGRLLQKSEKYQEAISTFNVALELGGVYFEHKKSVLNSIGSCYSNLGNEEEAEKYFEMAIQENHVNSYLTMAHLRIRQNRSFEVQRLFEKAIRLAPESVTVLQNIALAEFHMKNYNRSLLFYRKALAVDSKHLDSLKGIANLLQEQQQHLEAEHFYRKVQEQLPNAYESHANLGAILHLNQKHEEALKEYDTALKLNPNDSISKVNREKLMRVMKKRRNL